MIRQLNHILAREKVADLTRSAEKARLAHEYSAASNAEGNALNRSEQAIHEIQQCHLHDVWDKNITPACEGERIGHDTAQRGCTLSRHVRIALFTRSPANTRSTGMRTTYNRALAVSGASRRTDAIRTT